MVEIVPFAVATTAIDGLCFLTMKQVTEERGVVREFYRESVFVEAGLGSLGAFPQVNATETKQGGVRGMHAEDTTKLVAVVAGEAFGAWVDMRAGSPTRGAVVTRSLVPGAQVLVPRGVGNGFQAVAPGATQYVYCFEKEWVPGMSGLACTPLDPALAIAWPLPIDVEDRSQVSQKDLDAPLFADLFGADA